MDAVQTYTCLKCNKSKIKDNFHKNRSSKLGICCICKECAKKKTALWRLKNKKRIKEYSREYHIKNRNSIIKKATLWNKENKEKRNKRHKQRYREDPVYKLKVIISAAIYDGLKNRSLSKQGKSVWSVLPYTPERLKEHLESQFKDWMTWDNHGVYDKNKKTWHIDHIKPQVLFKFKSLEDKLLQECWDLNNLRPLEAIKNIRKSSLYKP